MSLAGWVTITANAITFVLCIAIMRQQRILRKHIKIVMDTVYGRTDQRD